MLFNIAVLVTERREAQLARNEKATSTSLYIQSLGSPFQNRICDLGTQSLSLADEKRLRKGESVTRALFELLDLLPLPFPLANLLRRKGLTVKALHTGTVRQRVTLHLPKDHSNS